MITVSILYPQVPGARFDFDYYLQRHMPRSIQLLSAHPGYRGVSVEKGLAGAEPGSAPGYVAMCHFRFESIEDLLQAFLPNAPELQGDIPNYTDVAPQIQINDVVIAG